MVRILVIDDDEDVLRILQRLLEQEGYTVVGAVDSEMGIKMQHDTPFDLIITDILMPGKEGISTISELTNQYPELKIIAISGGGDFEPYGYLDIAKRVGAHRTLSKPFTGKEILEAIESLIE